MAKMIKNLLILVALMYASGASAVLMSEAGSYDNLIAQTTLADSSAAGEEAWIEQALSDYLGYAVNVDYTQLGSVSAGDTTDTNWEAVTGTGSSAGDYAFDFGSGEEPPYYLVKLGGGAGAGADDTHYLFENFGDLQWAYVNLSWFGDNVSSANIGIVSHVGIVGQNDCCGVTQVPEPSLLALLSIGLLGFAGARRLQV
jgi:hypothetical protein